MKHRSHENCSVASGVVSSLPPTCYTTSSLTPKWVTAIGVVSFDLGLGQILTHLFPPLPLSIRQETDLAFLCFPDTNHTEYGHSLHHFIFPLNKKDCDNTRRTVFRMPLSIALSSASRETLQSSVLHYKLCDEEYFCTSIYLQQRDMNNERGTQQKALVFISLYGFPKIFETILEMVYGLVLDSANVAEKLESLYNDICSWPAPLPTQLYTGLHLLGKPLQSFRTPYYTRDQIGFRWREDGLSREEKCFLARLRLLEALENPCPDPPTIQRRLASCVLGPSAIEGLGEYIEKQLGLPLDVRAWRPSDVLAVIFAVRMRKYEEVDVTPSPEGILDEDSENIVNDDVKHLARHFHHFSKLTPQVAAVQNQELGYCRRLAKRLLFEHKDFIVNVDESDAPAMFLEFDVQAILFPHLNRLWKLWEILVTGEPLCIVGSNLGRVSAAGFCFYSLLAPLSLSVVLRPYVTINNSEVDGLLPRAESCSPVILGATNPFFLRHWSNSPHVLCLGSTGNYELQTHKTLPHSSLKKSNCQFDVKTNMFTSKHFLVRSEKHLWDECTANSSSVGVLNLPMGDRSVGGATLNVDPNESVRKTFLKTTIEFLLPLERAVEFEFEKSIPFFFYGEYVPSRVQIFSVLERSSDNDLPLHIFKGRRGMLKVYWRFMNTPTYKCWLRQRVFLLKRALLLRSKSLERVLLLEKDPCRRYEILMSLQYMLDTELKRPLLDVLLLKKLLYLTRNLAILRTCLSSDNNNNKGASCGF
ncbi:hypothetical protein MOQ_004399 [Trypanosoma cruzi marinkellei]|uniref:UDENN domain-containing protein n=1 Tax=Trypanosoma cruzi marinkellei TaxID=85056 RepID=K2MXC3_TRYCR|nr:hypothetical protein MOQ_004399 [Trypanosoma cruzi marinkellei]